MKTSKKRVFESKAAAVAARRIEDEEAAMFAGASPVRTVLEDGSSKAAKKSKPHRLTFEVDDALYYAIYQTVKRPGSRYKTISDFLREVAWRAVDQDAEA